MKKWMIGILAALMVTACGQKAEETAPAQTEAATEAETQETESSSEETSEEASEEETADETADPAEEKEITGTVVDAARNSIIIRTDDGQELSFSKEDAETDLKDGLLLDMKVTIVYTGEIDGNDASGAKVIRITDAE